MYFDKFLPFLSDGLLIKDVKESVKVSDIYCPLTSADDYGIKNTGKITLYHVLPLNIKVINMNDSTCKAIMNNAPDTILNCDVMYVDYSDIAKKIEMHATNALIKKNGAYVSQDGVLTDLFINKAANGIFVTADDISTLSLSIPISKGMKINTLQDAPVKVQEASVLGKARQSNKVSYKMKNTDYIYDWLRAYLQIPEEDELKVDGREVVPLLIGPTGVFKSATVKELCNEFGYRLVDFRVAFTSRLDYSGLYQKGSVDVDALIASASTQDGKDSLARMKDSLQGKDFSFSCPMEEIVTCSDGFREYCGKAVDVLKGVLQNGKLTTGTSSNGSSVIKTEADLTPEQINDINAMINKYSYYMKTPVLFFDEITRNKNAGVEGVLVEMLNQKRFGDMMMKRCKFIAATNMNFTNEKLDEIYEVETDMDVAYSNRFLPLKVYPEDVKGRWFDWAAMAKNGKQNIHPSVIEYLQKNPSEVYNENYVVEAFDSEMELDPSDAAKACPFPNYRTWEMMSNYIYTMEKNNSKVYNLRTVNGLINEKAAVNFTKFLETKGYKQEDEKVTGYDDVGRFIESSLDAGTPAMIIGPSSMGKTSRIEAYALGNDGSDGRPARLPAEIIRVDLSGKDNVDVMGYPVKKTLSQYVVGDLTKRNEFKNLSRELADLAEGIRMRGDTGLIGTLTVRAPDLTLQERFTRALADPTKNIIIFFDECNRVTNPCVMSAIFEATSDYRLFGISFKDQRDRVKVIAACNLGYKNAGSLDPALAARFSVYWKRKYDEKDATSFVNFLERLYKKKQIDKVFIDYIKTLSNDQILGFLKSVEERTLETATPASRMLSQLSKDIKNMKHAKMFCGALIFNDTDFAKITQLSELLTSRNAGKETSVKIDTFKTIVDNIELNKDSWAGIKMNENIVVNGDTITAQDVVDTLIELRDQLTNPASKASPMQVDNDLNIGLGFIDIISDIDNKISLKRKNTFEAYAGAQFANDFLPYFNLKFGKDEDEITIPMLTDIKLIPKFINQQLSAIVLVDNKILKCLELINDFMKEFKSSLSAEHYGKFLSCMLDTLPTFDNILMLISKMTVKEDEFMVNVEKNGDNVIKNVFQRCGLNVSDKEIKDTRDAISGNNTSVKKKSKIL